VTDPGPSHSLRVRPATLGDLDAIGDTERASFSEPWSQETFVGLLGRPEVLFLVLEGGGAGIPDRPEVLGHGVLWWVLDEGELGNLAVHPGARGKGGGGLLLDALLEAATSAGVEQVHLEVRASNDPARALYARKGFEPVGRRRGYYRNPPEDALLLRWVRGGANPSGGGAGVR
jgi:[ribosomal protein S18]-alanine N-acetyltransferase